MDKLFDENLIQIDYLRLLFGVLMLIAEILIVQFLYLNYSKSYNNKLKFAKNFIPFGISILIIVTVIKSSLALSLGLIGALSIIRFRTAIKEPEEIIMLLLIMGSAVSVAAEKELLSLMLVGIFCISYFILNRNKFKENFTNDVIIRFSENSNQEIDVFNDEFKNYIRQYSKNNDKFTVVYYKFHDQNLVTKIFKLYENLDCDIEIMRNES